MALTVPCNLDLEGVEDESHVISGPKTRPLKTLTEVHDERKVDRRCPESLDRLVISGQREGHEIPRSVWDNPGSVTE